MQWLNKIDEAIDRAFLPPPPTDNDTKETEGSNNDKGNDDDNDNATYATDGSNEFGFIQRQHKASQNEDFGLPPPSPRMERGSSAVNVALLGQSALPSNGEGIDAPALHENLESVEDGLYGESNETTGVGGMSLGKIIMDASTAKSPEKPSGPAVAAAATAAATSFPADATIFLKKKPSVSPRSSFQSSVVAASPRGSPGPGRIMRRPVPAYRESLMIDVPLISAAPPSSHISHGDDELPKDVSNESNDETCNVSEKSVAGYPNSDEQPEREHNENAGPIIGQTMLPAPPLYAADEKEEISKPIENQYWEQNDLDAEILKQRLEQASAHRTENEEYEESALLLSHTEKLKDEACLTDSLTESDEATGEYDTQNSRSDSDTLPAKSGVEQSIDLEEDPLEDSVIDSSLDEPSDGFSEESSMEVSEDDFSTDFLLPPTLTPWDEDETDSIFPSAAPHFEPQMNCHGVVHVRLFRAQRLPCPSGCVVHAVVSLPPWKGRIRTSKLEASYGPSDAGVCLRWNEEEDSHDESGIYEAKPAQCSMVHAYNSEDTPVPSISVKLVMSSSLQVFESDIFTLTLSCEPLMRRPGVWRRRWCCASTNSQFKRNERVSSGVGDGILFDEGYGNVTVNDSRGIIDQPLLLLEACFEPSDLAAKSERSLPSASVSLSSLPPLNDDLAEVSALLPSENEKRIFDAPSIDGLSVVGSPMPDSHARVKRLPEKLHLFRVMSSWTPAWCSVCSSLMTGWRVQSYQCETCGVLCCSDCQLQVDVEIPCGSDLAKVAAEKTWRNQLSRSRIMSVVAPTVRETANDTDGSLEDETKTNHIAREGLDLSIISNASAQSAAEILDEISKKEGIGELRVRIINAHLLERAFPPETELTDVMNSERKTPRKGDHYVRVSWTGSADSKRTRTIYQTSKPLFEEEMKFTVDHYGSEYRIEVIDANTDRPVGISLLSTQGVLQWQRDQTAMEQGIKLSSIMHPYKEKPKYRRMALELRAGLKDGFGLSFYNSKSQETSSSSKKERTRAGEIMGWIEVDIMLEEDLDLFYASDPRQCPPRPTEDFNIELIQLHIARISALINDIYKVIEAYTYMVSWKNPELTMSSLIILVLTCLRFNAEYIGSLPIFCLLVWMMHRARIRIRGDFKSRWIQREKKARIEAEKKMAVNYSIHRPIGKLEVQVLRGRNLRSKELGLPGTPFATVLWDPLRLASELKRKKVIKHDSTSGSAHEVGFVKSSGVGLTANPEWDTIEESSELRRMRQLLPYKKFWDNEDPQLKSLPAIEENTLQNVNPQSLDFPVLQPIKPIRNVANADGASEHSNAMQLAAWETSPGAVVVQVRSKLPVFEDILGEIVIPLKELLQENEIKGWFKLLDVGTKETVRGHSMHDQADKVVSDENNLDQHEIKKEEEIDGIFHEKMASEQDDYAEVFLRVSFSKSTSGEYATDAEQEISIVIAEEMIRFASITSENKIGMIGSSISTINTVRGLGGTIQNYLSAVLDIVESSRNALNFSSPLKSTLLFIFLLSLWLVLVLIPTRVLILCGVIGQYTATFIAAYFPTEEKESNKPEEYLNDEESKEPTASPIVTRFMNFFRALPTDEDLRRSYFWEARRVGEREREKLATKKRTLRLEKLWHVQWYGNVKLKETRLDMKRGETSSRSWEWEEIFAILEGHRFIYWRDVKHFDDGDTPLGQIYFAGHSGLAGLSPLDMRELTKDEIPLVVCIFGRGMREQQKIALKAKNKHEKEQLEDAVMMAAFDKKND